MWIIGSGEVSDVTLKAKPNQKFMNHHNSTSGLEEGLCVPPPIGLDCSFYGVDKVQQLDEEALLTYQTEVAILTSY